MSNQTEFREELRKLKGKRLWLRGVFRRQYRDKCNGERNVLLTDVFKDEKEICDHLWFKYTRKAQKMDLRDGEEIEIDCRVPLAAYENREEETENFGVHAVQNIRRVKV